MLPDWVTPYRAYTRLFVKTDWIGRRSFFYGFMTYEEFQQVVWC